MPKIVQELHFSAVWQPWPDPSNRTCLWHDIFSPEQSNSKMWHDVLLEFEQLLYTWLISYPPHSQRVVLLEFIWNAMYAWDETLVNQPVWTYLFTGESCIFAINRWISPNLQIGKLHDHDYQNATYWRNSCHQRSLSSSPLFFLEHSLSPQTLPLLKHYLSLLKHYLSLLKHYQKYIRHSILLCKP